MDPRLIRAFRAAAETCGILVAALGVLVLAGWWLDIPVLKSLTPALASMKANTAMLLVCTGVAVRLLSNGRLPVARAAVGAVVIAVSALTMGEHVLGVDLRIDQVLVRDPALGGPDVPGRMSLATSFCFLLLGVATLPGRGGLDVPLRQFGALAAGATGFLALCGYLYGVSSLYRIGPYSTMALHTALGLIVAGAGLLLARPAEGFMAVVASTTSAGQIVRRLVPVVVLLPVAIGWLRLRGELMGLYGGAFGLALMVLATVSILGSLTFWIAARLHRSELLRRLDEEELLRSTARIRLISESSSEFAAASVELPELREIVARRLGQAVGDLCTVRLIDRDSLRFESAAGLYHPEPEMLAEAHEVSFRSPQRVGEGLVGGVAATGEPVFIPAIETARAAAQAPPQFRAWVERLGITGIIAVPLVSKGRVIGVISLTRGRAGPPYTRDDLRLAQDLADRATLAIENARLLDDLEERVARRTADLQAANRELESFSFSISHDLRAPLRAIDGFGQILLEDFSGVLDDRGKDYLGRMRRGCQRMGTLIDDLLKLSRVVRAELRAEEADLGALARGVAEHLAAGEPGRVVEFVTRESVPVRGDPGLLRAALENLLDNAWKFTAKTPSPRVEFGVERDGPEPVYFVRDNGAGFDMQYAGKLFESFQRLHRQEEFPGTGIGLATVQRIVSRHGGRIWAESAVGRGATFYFTLNPA